MPRLSIWNSGVRGSDFKFLDRVISNAFFVGGTSAFLHLYLGVYEQASPLLNADGTTTPAADPNNPTPAQDSTNVTTIQDVLFLENRDRKYDPNVYELRTIYNVADSDFDLKQFGLFLSGDTKFLEFHFNDMIATIGRKIMPGDVIELPHERDEFLLNGGPAINKFYVVEDANKASGGFSATWFYHIWRVKVSPMPDSQEYQDILAQQAVNPLGLPQTNADGTPVTLKDIMSSVGIDTSIDEAVVADALANFTYRYFDTTQFWFTPGTANITGTQNPWVFAGSSVPPNGAVLVGSGTAFPLNPTKGDYFLRTDYVPPVLYQYNSTTWMRQETDFRDPAGDGSGWSVAHALLRSFICNDTVETYQNGQVGPQKVNISQVVNKPGVDF